jgi:hypothetical protein
MRRKNQDARSTKEEEETGRKWRGVVVEMRWTERRRE